MRFPKKSFIRSEQDFCLFSPQFGENVLAFVYRLFCSQSEIRKGTQEDKMTKKDYELIARSIYVDRDTLDETQKETADLIANGLADQFQAMNPRFNRGLFLTACGYKKETREFNRLALLEQLGVN